MLGGFRVLGDSLLLAKIHGCAAPLFFALCAALVTLTSRPWQQHVAAQVHPAARCLHRSTLAASVLQRAGLDQVFNVVGGMTAWAQASFPVTT